MIFRAIFGGLFLICAGVFAEDGVDKGLAIYRNNSMEDNNRVYEGETYWWNGDSVEDKDAVNGMAQRAFPDKHKNGHSYVFCSGQDTKIPPGRYKVVFRLKIPVKPKQSIPVCDLVAYNHSGIKDYLFVDRRPLKTDDFKQAGTYQDFTISLERYDIAFAVIVADWKKQIEFFVDRVTLIPEHYFSDEELCGKTKLIVKENKVEINKTTVVAGAGKKFLVIAGPYYQHYRFSDALKKITSGSADVSYAICDGVFGESLKPKFPNPSKLAEYDAVIILDVPASQFHITGRLALKEYIENGGALFVAGGPFGLGAGGYGNTFFEKILPVTLDGPNGFKPMNDDNLVKLSDNNILTGLFNKEKIGVGWCHRVGGKDGAVILLEAGKVPIMTLGKYGKGKVAVLAATPVGECKAGNRMLLESADWPELLARILNRLTEKNNSGF